MKNITKKILLSFVIIMGFAFVLPTNIFAEGLDEFSEKIIVKSNTKESEIDILKDEVDETITFDKDTLTLTLNNFNGTKIDIKNYYEGKNLKLKLIGNNNIVVDKAGFTSYGDNVYSYGLSFSGSGLEIIGSGALNISSTKEITSGIGSIGGKFIIDGANINIKNVDVGITASDFRLKNGNIKINDVSKHAMILHPDAVEMDGDGIINGGTLDLKGSNGADNGIYLYGGILDVNGGKISISNFNKGIYSNNTMESAAVNINDGNTNIQNVNYGIYMDYAGELNVHGGILKIKDSKSMAAIITDNFDEKNKINIDNSKVAIAQGDISVQSYSTSDPENKTNVLGKNGINASNLDSMVAKNVTILPLIDKKLIKTENGLKVTPNNEVKFVFDIDMSKFRSLYINGELLSLANGDYTVKSGSTIITLSKEYTENLKDGNYKLMAVFEDRIAYNDFKVGDEKTSTTKVEQSNVKNPNTSDNIVTYVLLFMVSFVGIIKTSSTIKKKSN